MMCTFDDMSIVVVFFSDDSTSGKKKGKSKTKSKKDYKTNSGDEAIEESDEADEGREVDYMTDTDR